MAASAEFLPFRLATAAAAGPLGRPAPLVMRVPLRGAGEASGCEQAQGAAESEAGRSVRVQRRSQTEHREPGVSQRGRRRRLRDRPIYVGTTSTRQLTPLQSQVPPPPPLDRQDRRVQAGDGRPAWPCEVRSGAGSRSATCCAGGPRGSAQGTAGRCAEPCRRAELSATRRSPPQQWPGLASGAPTGGASPVAGGVGRSRPRRSSSSSWLGNAC